MAEPFIDRTCHLYLVAVALAADPVRGEEAGRLMALLVHPASGADPLTASMRLMGADAASRGLTAALVEAKLAAHKAECRR